jgi:MFS family permease
LNASTPAAAAPPDPATQAGYRELLRGNRNFRLLWLGTVISLFGDWFNTIALYALVTVLTGSPLAVGLVEALKLSGFAIASIPAGILADRFDRRRLMIVADLLRAALVPCFLLIESVGDLPLLYALIVGQIALGALFDPAFRALMPNLVTQRELLTANTLLSATWSTLLAVGASVGGIAAAGLGLDAVFVIDAATYLLSAVCIALIHTPRRAPAPGPWVPRHPFRAAWLDLVEGIGWLRQRADVLKLSLAKTAWALGGAALVYFLTQLGPRMTPGDPALGIGLLYAARGLGTGIGPILGRAVFRDRRVWATVAALAVGVSGLMYALVGAVGTSFLLVVPLVIAHAASGANWVFSTVLLQEQVPDHVRGRVFSVEMMILTTLEAIIILAAAALLEDGAFTLTAAFLVFGGLQTLSGLGYAWWLGWRPGRSTRAP